MFDASLAGQRTERRGGPRPSARSLDHFVLMEQLAYRSYRKRDFPARCWRAKAGPECDFVPGRGPGPFPQERFLFNLSS